MKHRRQEIIAKHELVMRTMRFMRTRLVCRLFGIMQVVFRLRGMLQLSHELEERYHA